MHNLAEKIQKIKEHLPGVEERLVKRGDKPELPLQTLPLFNKKIWGLRPGALTVLGARTSNGKTALSGQIAYDLASQGHETLFLSLEQTESELIERLFCNIAKVDNFKLLTGQFNTDKSIRDKWESFKTFIKTMPLIITCGIGKNFKEVNDLIEAFKVKPKVVIVDYVQNVSRKTNEGREVLNEYIRYFRELMVKNNIAGVLCSQINRCAIDDKNKEPSLSTLKETGSLEECADVCFLVHYNYFYSYDEREKNDFKIIVAKNRNGRTGEHHLLFFPEFYRFEDKVAKEEEKLPYKDAQDIFGGEVVVEKD